ncbi:MAG: TIR domain-containing protein [Acidobacteriota bacterium]
MSMPAPLGRIVTFYSYKGGTGRSMALANVAWTLASTGYRVLAIDWDLEAPGLHRYFRPYLRDPTLASSEGIIDFFIAFADASIAASRETAADDGAWFRDCADLRMFASALDWQGFPKDGRLEFVPAGRQDSGYSTRVNSFNWSHLYTKLGGGIFLEEVKRQLRETYDYVLIDSRTGVSDTSGICTVQLPDTLVVCFTLNEQSIEGAANTMSSAAAQRQLPSGESTLRILPVPTRVDDSEKERVEAARDQARRRFDRFLGWLDEDQLEEYWAAIEVPYKAFYSFEEVLAVFGDATSTRSSMLAAVESLASWITEKDVTRFPRLDEAVRVQQLARFLRRRPPRVALDQSYVFFVSYAAGDLDSYGQQFVSDLIEEVRLLRGDSRDQPIAFLDRRLEPGDSWTRGLTAVLESSAVMVSLVSPAYVRSQHARAELGEFSQAGKPVLPVEWIPVSRDIAPEYLQQLPWFRASADEAQAGLRHLLRLSQTAAYAAAVSTIARTVVDLAATVLMPPQREATPAPPRLLVAIAAERKDVMQASRPGRYGMRRRDWIPFQDPGTMTIAQFVDAARQPTGAAFLSLHRFDRWLMSTPRPEREVALIIVDPFTLAVTPEYQTELGVWLEASRAPVAVIVAWDGNDSSNTMMIKTLQDLQQAVQSSRQRSGWPLLHVAEDPDALRGIMATAPEELWQQAELLLSERRRWHPDDALLRSGELTPCSLTIDPGYQSDKRWREWGDPRVSVVSGHARAYLLPSKAAPLRMRTPRALKEQGGLPHKQSATAAFIERYGQKPLQGFWFYRKMSDGKDRVHVYSPEYDQFLRDALEPAT